MELDAVKTLSYSTSSPEENGSLKVNDLPCSADKIKENAPDAEDKDTYSICEQKLKCWVIRHSHTLKSLVLICLLLGYCVYFVIAIRHSERTRWTEDSWRLVWVTCVLGLIIMYNLIAKTGVFKTAMETLSKRITTITSGKCGRIIRWFCYVTMTGFMVVYVVVYVAMRRPDNLQSIFGLFGFPTLLLLYSNNRRKFIMALIILKTTWGAEVIHWVANRVLEYLDIGSVGSTFLFGSTYKDHSLAFGASMQLLFFIVGISVLTYLGVITALVNTVGRALAFCLHTTAPEGINSVGNIFLSVPESVLLVQRYIPEMTPSQLFVTYTGVLATISGVSLVLLIDLGFEVAPLLAASAMSAPAALAACKLVFPSYDGEVVPGHATDAEHGENNPLLRKANSMIDAIMLGIQQSVPIIVQALAFLGTSVMVLEFVNRTFVWFGDRVGIENLTLELILSYVFYPTSYMLGAPGKDCLVIGKDCLVIGRVLGVRTVYLPLVAFKKLSPIVKNGRVFREYISESVNNTWTSSGPDIYLENCSITLFGGIMEERSEILTIYALCGFASVGMLDFMLGTFSVILPSKLGDVTRNSARAMAAGFVASYTTASFAGLLYEN